MVQGSTLGRVAVERWTLTESTAFSALASYAVLSGAADGAHDREAQQNQAPKTRRDSKRLEETRVEMLSFKAEPGKIGSISSELVEAQGGLPHAHCIACKYTRM